jgi:putative Mn2+ efflux pump MntP
MVLLFLTAFALGAAHAVAPDHVAAVGVFVSRARTPREALAHGAHWGVGHAATLTVAGLAVLFASSAWPALVSARAEWLVGVVLIGLGARTVWSAWRWRGVRDLPHAHGPHGHRHPLLGVGMLHGLAGSGAMAAVVPLGTGQRPMQAAVWLVLFGIGTIVAMSLISGAMDWSFRSSTRRAGPAMRWLVGASGAISMVVGAVWLMPR